MAKAKLGWSPRNPQLAGYTMPIIRPFTQYAGDIGEIFSGLGTFPENLVEFAGRVCYFSTASMGNAPDFIAVRIREGHTDILEHGWISLSVEQPGINAETEFYKKCKYLVADPDPSDNARMLISGNFRAWLDSFGHNDDVIGECAIVAPTIFKPESPSAVTLHSATSYDIKQRQIGQARVSLLAIHSPPLFDLPQERKDVHRSATFLVEGVSRTCSHQFVRHRLGSFCLSGDTIVPSFRRSNRGSGKKWTMKTLHEWSSDPSRKGRIPLIRLRGMNDRGELIPVRIKKIICSGTQPVYRVSTESGRQIKATMNHQFSTPDGWRKLSDISVGDTVWANGVPAYKNEDYIRQRYLVENTERKVLAAELGVSDATLGKWIAKFRLQKPKRLYPNRQPGYGKKGMFSEQDKEAISQRMTGAGNHRWKDEQIGDSGGRLRANRMYLADQCSRCGSTHRVQRHHRDVNPKNNSPENIAILCELCHKAEHHGQVVMTVFRDRVTSIEFAGNEITYDIEIDHECHNFVANGFVVHNSQESQRYVDLAKGDWQAVIPPAIAENPEALATLNAAWQADEEAYAKLRSLGIRKEDARFLLPNAAETRFVVTMSMFGWKDFLRQRDTKKAQWEIRVVAQMVRDMLQEVGFAD